MILNIDEKNNGLIKKMEIDSRTRGISHWKKNPKKHLQLKVNFFRKKDWLKSRTHPVKFSESPKKLKGINGNKLMRKEVKFINFSLGLTIAPSIKV